MSRKSLCSCLALVFAFTVLNFLAHRESTRFFTEAAQQQSREMTQIAATAKAQEMASRGLAVAELQGAQVANLQGERDEALASLLQHMRKNQLLARFCEEQAAYIALLRDTLKSNDIALPEPTLAEPLRPVPTYPAPSGDKST